MKQGMVFAIAALLALVTFPAGAQGTPLDDYKPVKVAPHTWVIFGPTEQPSPQNRGFMNNPAFVETGNSVIVVDPGSSVQIGEGVLKHIRAHTDKLVTHIFISHVHGDHWLGNQAIKQAFPEVKIYAHPEMIKEAKAGQAEQWVSLMDTLTEGATKGTEAVIPAIVLEDGQEIDVDGVTIRTHLSDWAHTKTDAMFEVVQDKLLITGDNVTNKRIARMDDGSFRGNMAAIDKAIALDVEHVVPGHGPSGGKELLSQFRDYLDIVYSGASELREEGLEPYEMKEQLLPKATAYQNWPGFEDEFGKHISLATLEAEQAEFE